MRRSTLLSAGGYDGDVLFENLELCRTVRAVGGREVSVPDLFVARRPPTTRHFWGQRVRQAYDDFAQPARLVVEAALLPAVALGLRDLLHPGRRRRGTAGLVVGCSSAVVLAELGRRRHGGRTVFPPSAALWAPVWGLERAVGVWLAIGQRFRGGMPYGGQRLATAAHSVRELRARLGPARREGAQVRANSAASARTAASSYRVPQ